MKCFLCGNGGVYKNRQGVAMCRRHKESELIVRCPICKTETEIIDGKMWCAICNKTWSQEHMRGYRDE